MRNPLQSFIHHFRNNQWEMERESEGHFHNIFHSPLFVLPHRSSSACPSSFTNHTGADVSCQFSSAEIMGLFSSSPSGRQWMGVALPRAPFTLFPEDSFSDKDFSAELAHFTTAAVITALQWLQWLHALHDTPPSLMARQFQQLGFWEPGAEWEQGQWQLPKSTVQEHASVTVNVTDQSAQLNIANIARQCCLI